MEPHPGVFVSSVSTAEWTPPQRETVHIIEGSVRIEIRGGATLELQAGDIASFPAGLEMVWHITPPFKEFWVFG